LTARVLGHDLRAAASEHPGKDALVVGERALSYAELDRAADAVGTALQEHGVRRGDRVALVLPNGAAAAIAIYGALRAGAAFSPLNPTTKQDKLAYVLANSGAKVVLCDGERADVVAAAAAEVGKVEVLEDVEALASGPASPPAPPIDLDLAGLIYTSGSTGDPKGVTLTHRNMTFAADSIIEYLEMGLEDRVLCVLPLSFDYGLFQLLMSVRAGATLVLEPGFAFPGRVVQLLEQHRITGLPGVPTVFQVLVSLHGLAERELPDLRFLTNTGAALAAESIEAIRHTFPGARLYSMYGLTECKRVSYLPPEQLDVRPTSVGIPIPGTEAWIEDDAGNRLGPGEVGELIVRGAHVMQGYWGDREATLERLRPGRWPWERVLATGDLFRADDEGYLYFVGRRDDIIKSRGEKVAPREVEDVLHRSPDVGEAAVIGVPDRLLGQAIVAHVAPKPGHELEPEGLKGYCVQRLEDFKVPQHVVVHEQLPRTSNGKIDRLALAEADRDLARA
jgi:long-chain acyl-CoA synthetase